MQKNVSESGRERTRSRGAGAVTAALSFLALLALVVGVSYRVPPLKYASADTTVKFCVPGDVAAVSGAESVKNGADTIICCSGENATRVLEQLPVVTATTLAFPGNQAKLYEYVNRLGLTVTRVEDAAGVYSVYGYSPHLRGETVRLYGEKVNVQIAVSSGLVSLGFPLLMTDF